MAWIAERHDMATSVPAFQHYRHIQPCSAQNCPDHYLLHSVLADLGYNAWPLHRQHRCAYYLQHADEGSAFYQVAHVATAYPKKHESVVVDECNLPNWLVDGEITLTQLQQARMWLSGRDWRAELLLRALDETIIAAGRGKGSAVQGKAFFDALDRHTWGRLVVLVQELASDVALMNAHPTLEFDLDRPDALEAVRGRGPVILPRLIRGLERELPRWLGGGAWNSRLHVLNGRLHLLEPRRFSLEEGEVLPLAILDATADGTLLSLLLGGLVCVERGEIEPPPGMRHIAVRTGKRYPKYSLTEAKHKEQSLARVVKEVRYLLDRLDPHELEEAAGRVGLITYLGCEVELGERLGIPEQRRGHFWGVRGSNAFEECSILLIVGTPLPNVDQIGWWARALYAEDPSPIDTSVDEGEDGRRHFRDPRVQGLADYLVRTELTQAAHRNRPLRYEDRVVVTLTTGEVDYLPITEEYTSLPNLTEQGTTYDDERTTRETGKLREAWEALVRRGEKVTGKRLAKEAKVRPATAGSWLRTVRGGGGDGREGAGGTQSQAG